ncbi:GNAT family N-acetyltransferase [Fulvivirga sedimenti]|uniref:GNAT family N-acetyltransferase n=1 Tax=Fulvivirga sedimenti TaxID=2879465 RepID=A0A9X1HWU6_9BACT|nr:GNAT family N-acetyltransferase [Fulvivirga sedimenti]MCA6077939.1 GNAT family N-acetyltransferase [Fulvivirga sedimenti]
MKQLVTQRLRIIPLTKDQLLLLEKQDRSEVLKQLGLSDTDLKISAGESFRKELDNAYPHICRMIDRNPEYFEFCTHWWMILQNTCVGGIGFAGPPDEQGVVMIGYYIDKRYENLGFATEGLGAMTDFAFQNNQVRSIIADTLPDGLASQRVLIKTGFRNMGRAEEGIRFRLDRSFK